MSKTCFVIMPFGEVGTPEHSRNTKIYQLMIKPVIEQFDYSVVRADELGHMGNITKGELCTNSNAKIDKISLY